MRPDKYDWLQQHTLTTTTWSTLTPHSPFYLFRPQDAQWFESYQKGWKLTDIFPVNVLGFQTHRDHFAVDFDRATVEQRATDLRDAKLSDDAVRDRYGVKDNRDWQLASARATLKADADWQSKIIECAYRPFDHRYCYFSGAFMDYPRRELLDHVVERENLFAFCRHDSRLPSASDTLGSRRPLLKAAWCPPPRGNRTMFSPSIFTRTRMAEDCR
jgi:hypothetical protein